MNGGLAIHPPATCGVVAQNIPPFHYPGHRPPPMSFSPSHSPNVKKFPPKVMMYGMIDVRNTRILVVTSTIAQRPGSDVGTVFVLPSVATVIRKNTERRNGVELCIVRLTLGTFAYYTEPKNRAVRAVHALCPRANMGHIIFPNRFKPTHHCTFWRHRSEGVNPPENTSASLHKGAERFGGLV